jgi:hypothetical protein
MYRLPILYVTQLMGLAFSAQAKGVIRKIITSHGKSQFHRVDVTFDHFSLEQCDNVAASG